MARRSPGLFLCASALFLCFSSGCSAGKRRVLEIPEGLTGVIAYGSLISLTSMEQTLGHKYEGPVHEVHLRGWGRVWTCVRPFNEPQAIAAGSPKMEAHFLRDGERVPVIGAAELNVFPKKTGRINGILYLITEKDLLKLDKRERGYRRADVSGDIEEFRFSAGKVFVYEGLPVSPVAASVEKGTYVLIKEFRDSVTGACDLRGKSFRDEFDRSTKPCDFPVLSYKDIVWEKGK